MNAAILSLLHFQRYFYIAPQRLRYTCSEKVRRKRCALYMHPFSCRKFLRIRGILGAYRAVLEALRINMASDKYSYPKDTKPVHVYSFYLEFIPDPVSGYREGAPRRHAYAPGSRKRGDSASILLSIFRVAFQLSYVR